MSMSPIGITGLVDEEANFEVEIAQQLEQVNLDADDIDDFPEDQEDMGCDVDAEISPEISNYIKRMQEQTANFEQELNECDELLQHSYKNDSRDVILHEESQTIQQAASEMGLDVEQYRRKILEDIEKEDELPLEELLYDDTISLIGENELEVGSWNGDAPDHIADGIVAVIDQTANIQKILQQQIEEMEQKQKEKEAKIQQEKDLRLQLENKEAGEAEERHQQRLNRIQQAEEEVIEEKMIHQKKMETMVQQKEDEMKQILEEQQKTINNLSMQVKEETERYEEDRKQEEMKQSENKLRAVAKIQSFYRGYSVRKLYGDILQEAKTKWQEKKREERIAQVEIEIVLREKEKKRKEAEEEERMRLQAEKQLEEQCRIQEEQRKQLEKEAKKLEKERKEEADKKEKELKAEQKRQQEAKRKEEKRKLKEEQERLENEKKKEAEIERKKKEQQKLENERKEIEQKERQKQEQDRLQNEKREKEQEERRQIEEQERLESERRAKEQEEKAKHKLAHERLESERREKEEEMTKQKLQQDRLESKRREKEKQEKPRVKKTEEKEIAECRLADDGRKKEQEENKKDDIKMKQSEETSRLIVGELPVEIEARRLEWIKNCIPWSKVSNEPWKLKLTKNKVIRRPSSAKKMQPIPEHVILTAAQASSLRQVSTVQLEDLPGCSLSTLGQCWGLQCLKAVNCGLVAVEGLQSCRQLRYLDLKNNSIVYVDLKDTGSLQYVNLSHNSLSAMHGMDNCSNLRWLDLSDNKIARIGGLGTLRRLHTLILASNQLINTDGLADVPTLQTLVLSHNHLQQLEDMDKLCLLQHLNASANNILKIPPLKNHVLLQEINLEDNSIDSLQYFSSYWLPLLTNLNLAQNSVDKLESLKHLCMLNELNISSNQLLDGESLLETVNQCRYLRSVKLDDNPASQSMSPRLFEMLPRLESVNKKDIKYVDQTSGIRLETNFEAMCLTQVQLYKDLASKFEQDLGSVQSRSPVELHTLCDVYFSHCDKSFKMAVEHRYAHEYGDTILTVPTAPTTPKPERPLSARMKHLQNMDRFMSPKEMFEKALNSPATESDVSNKMIQKNAVKENCVTSISANVVGKMLENELEEKSARLESYAATKIQATWKGYQTRKTMKEECLIDNKAPVSHHVVDMKVSQERCDAATKIQAAWRGYSLRCIFQAALEYARLQDDDDDDLEFPDIDLEQFNFDEKLIEDDLRPPDTPELPASFPVLGKPPSGRPHGDNISSPESNYSPPSKPMRAWPSSESRTSDVSSLVGKLARPVSAATSSVTLETYRTIVSKKEEQITEEWGFKDSSTAHLMLQRAKKMKYNSERRKKLSKLDPKQRLALFRKLEETTGKNIQVHPPPHKTLPRKEYFQDRQNEINQQQRGHQEESHTRVDRTYEWVHTQVGTFPETSSADEGLTSKAFYGSEGNLPKLDKEILGKRTGNMQNRQACMELLSVDSGSLHGDMLAPRRYSAGEDNGTKFPPIKTSSAPSIYMKEKMSWRTKKGEASVGWGGGKKRNLRK